MQLPKYQAIADELIDRIERGELRSGDRLPTETELGAQYGVSRITVIHAIRVLESKNLVYRKRGSGTFIARRKTADGDPGPRTEARMSFVSVIFPHSERNGAHEVLTGIEGECARNAFYVTVHNSKNRPVVEHDILMDLMRQGSDGAIVYPCASTTRNIDVYSELVVRRFPFVFIDRRVDFLPVPFVACDNQGSMRGLITHVIAKGHERVGFLYNSLEAYSSERDRFKGYCEAHIAAGLKVEQELLFSTAEQTSSNGYTMETEDLLFSRQAEAALEYFWNLARKPTCIAAVHDLLAIALMKAALARGIRVPGDLSITGFDDLPAAAVLEVPLTTVRQPFQRIGSEAAKLLLGCVRGNWADNTDIRIPAETVDRESVRTASQRDQ